MHIMYKLKYLSSNLNFTNIKNGLENRRGASLRGFESLSLRQFFTHFKQLGINESPSLG